MPGTGAAPQRCPCLPRTSSAWHCLTMSLPPLARKFFSHFRAELGPKLCFPVLASTRRPAPLQRPPRPCRFGGAFSPASAQPGGARTSLPCPSSPQGWMRIANAGPSWKSTSVGSSIHPLPRPAEPHGRGPAVAHGTAACRLLQGCWGPEHGARRAELLPGAALAESVSWTGEGGDFPAGAGTVPGARGVCLSRAPDPPGEGHGWLW